VGSLTSLELKIPGEGPVKGLHGLRASGAAHPEEKKAAVGFGCLVQKARK